MQSRTVPPAVIGLLAGVATTAAAVALSATGLLPVWATTPLLLLTGGLAAGLAAPVRPTIGAFLGGVTGLFAAVLLTAVTTLPAGLEATKNLLPFLAWPILMMWGMLFVPVYTFAGAVGAAVRPRIAKPWSAIEGLRSRAPGRRHWAGIAGGALCIIVGTWMWVLIGRGSPVPVIVISALAGGVAAGLLSRGGVRAGADAGLLAGIFGLGIIAIWGMWQISTGAGNELPAALWPFAVAVRGFLILPAVALGGALGGSFRKPSGPSGVSPEPEM